MTRYMLNGKWLPHIINIIFKIFKKKDRIRTWYIHVALLVVPLRQAYDLGISIPKKYLKNYIFVMIDAPIFSFFFK